MSSVSRMFRALRKLCDGPPVLDLQPGEDIAAYMRFAVAHNDREISITSLQTQTTVDLPSEDLPALIATLQSLDQTLSRVSPPCRGPSP